MTSTDHQIELVPHTYQGALIQQRSADGYINATAMCKAAGREWSSYRRSAEPFVTALEGSLQIRRDLIIQSITAGANDARGTWVHPQVAIHLAQWLSPEFAVKVTEWVYEWMSGKKPSDRVWAQFEDRVSLVYDNVPLGYFCVFREIADLFASMISNGADFGTRMILDLSVGNCWGPHWTKSGYDAQFGARMKFDHHYPPYFPQAWSNPQDAWCYPEDALPTFKRWLREVYVPHKMPAYLKSQVAQKKLAAPIANNALAALAAREGARSLPRPGK
ncbi:KilA-N domain-containing protein [Sphingomonas sp. 3-13AW]|uniref:KilA-N domain-containing protein n=1 Tax=Sphingomonas sp. 3-13AW TaxID=3050450 RepID=UPI003BB66CB6